MAFDNAGNDKKDKKDLKDLKEIGDRISLEGRLARMDAEGVRMFLESQARPCYESRLLKIAFFDMEICRTAPLTLYQAHFALFHLLYGMQEEYAAEGRYLHIHFMRIFLTDYPANGRCRHYDEMAGRFCGEVCNERADLCRFHREKIRGDAIDSLSLRYFYLDEKNYAMFDEKTIEAFINGTWELMAGYRDYEKSIRVLDLPSNPDIGMVKQKFRRLAKEYHPDMAGGEENGKEKFNEINRAYQVLMRLLPFAS